VLALAALATLASAAALADTYTLDPNHTYPSMEMSHMGYSIWRGKFNRSSGKVVYDPVKRTGSVEVLVDTSSVDWGLDKMNEIAQTLDWLDVAHNPTMTYKGSLVFDGDKVVAVDGELTLKGVMKPVRLTVNTFKCAQNPYFKKFICGADAEGDLDRADFGLKLYADNGAGKMHLRIQVEGSKDE
jgi:polyisoprenoid-binding protein YceI